MSGISQFEVRIDKQGVRQSLLLFAKSIGEDGDAKLCCAIGNEVDVALIASQYDVFGCRLEGIVAVALHRPSDGADGQAD